MTSNQLAYQANKERERSNRAVEAETSRSNRAREVELNRHNLVTEAEIERHNRATELLTKQQVEEMGRHNLVVEAQQDRSQAEVERANLANESLKGQQIALGYANLGLGYQQLSELQRHNQAGEQATLIDLNNKREYNSDLIRQNEFRLQEDARANRAREDQARLNWLQGYAQLGETQVHNRATETEAAKSRKQRAGEALLNFGANMTRSGVSWASTVYAQ